MSFSTRLYDPSSDVWLAAADLPAPLVGSTTTLLKDGRVLLVGRGTAVYEPETGRWRDGGMTLLDRGGHTATRLLDGRVLVAGGVGRTSVDFGEIPVLPEAEVFDAATGRWAPTAPMQAPRVGQAAALLPDGRVLVAGGERTSGTAVFATAEIYDPDEDRWETIGRPPSHGGVPVVGVTATGTTLLDGRVLFAGGSAPGRSGSATPGAIIYDPTVAAWIPMPLMRDWRSGHTATLLADGTVLVAGGGTQGRVHRSAERYNPRADRWDVVAEMSTARKAHTATLLTDGRLLVAGGQERNGTGTLGSAECFESDN